MYLKQNDEIEFFKLEMKKWYKEKKKNKISILKYMIIMLGIFFIFVILGIHLYI